ncbi:FadR/GntR family transcriptional regulator [Phyllobacterium endophyticum]|uniref:FadR/GntR family transcriptional regulator n=1 Tax=Phyllobacterium endophyticum TaxID=1149773 RepID=UPI0011C8FD70|nr:FadR/GntR family transcriptional regulator [Phyllobacterium endophyticum]TXR47698.1 FadR family transcriptional regulator [Phyllobacterium endophyticum]
MATDIVGNLKVARKPKLSETVVDAIREQLRSGMIQPGQKLPTEGQLTEAFGVSRTVIREALATLAASGLVEPRQGAGVFVVEQISTAFGALTSEMGTKDSIALNVLEVRLAIEIESAGLAAIRRNAAQEAAIQEAFFEFDDLLLKSEPTGPADLAFHRAIASATNNPFYVEMLDVLGRRAIPCDVTSPWSTEIVQSDDYQRGLQREHLAILGAISAGDAETARNAMRLHLTASQKRYRERLQARQSFYKSASAVPSNK